MTDKPAARTGYHHGDLPAALTRAALELLDEQGLERVTVREVARRAGVSPGAPFRHFADRQALLTAVADVIITDYEAWQLAQPLEEYGGPVRAFGLGFIRYAIRHPHRFTLMRTRVFGPAQPDGLQHRLIGIERSFTEMLVEGQRLGELREGDPEVMRLTAQAVVYGLSQMIVDGYLPPDQALAEQILDTFGLGIVNLP
ncbi:TetR/AcrR family transcriptional regulator [Streptomyces sp. NPDC059009]|uniref:TetR/AcrR family transcriptional regulator n=1 Tax=Streptomyces sp. NPDC059009 TaxID=3346694 RepID=UPI0036C81306